ncbi:hypothetical protein PLICBS_003865 [Purpureocillium lilacinum]|uniref:uncharacterized protein n=1 Tax=Purpureocillium lilacinum TaxID=33203 RepID=UPI00208AD45D|nr:hypothetical protein PLICBS_003865 [Purpureocillium lilacinum]
MPKQRIVQKDSGELVRPALRDTPKRPSNLLGKPRSSKAVHFDDLEHIRHFQKDGRPIEVKTASVPTDETNDYNCPNTFRENDDQRLRLGWELVNNKPYANHDSHYQGVIPVWLETVWLSSDQTSLLGSIAVANLAWRKHVACRFSFDNWHTVSEVNAEYSGEVRTRIEPVEAISRDRFIFTITISDIANLETKAMAFCIRYSVNGEDFWDNNMGNNFEVRFRRRQSNVGREGGQEDASHLAQDQPSNDSTELLRRSLRQTPSDTFHSDCATFALNQPDGERIRHLAELQRASIASPSLALLRRFALSSRYNFKPSLLAAFHESTRSATNNRRASDKSQNISNGKFIPETALSGDPMNGSHTNGSHLRSATPQSASYEELIRNYCFTHTPAWHFSTGTSPTVA